MVQIMPLLDLQTSNDVPKNPSVHGADSSSNEENGSGKNKSAEEKHSGTDTEENGASDKDSGSGSGDSETSSAAERRRLSDDGSYAVTGCSDGEIIVWHLFSGQPICCLNTDGSPLALSRMARNIYAGQLVNDFPKVELKDSGSLETFLNLQTTQHATPQRKNFTSNPDDPISIPKVTLQSRNTITNILILAQRIINDGNVACIVTASTDGFIRAWSIHHTNGGLKALFFAGHRIGSFVETMCTDASNELLFTGDTCGYVKIWLLCDWAQSEEHLVDHRHHFDPRNFPFIKRHKFFSPIIAFLANHMMQQTVSTLPSAQRGFYRQPYLLNSYQAHLLRITQIQIVPPKTVIVTGSADCSVRLWQYSGLYIGTLGQPLDFEHESSQSSQILPEVASKVNLDNGDFLNEDEDPDEIVLKPKVVVPVDLAAHGSAVTLNVLHSTQHKRTIIPDSELNKIDESDIADENPHERSDYITALGELNVKKQRFDASSPPTDFSSLAKASEERDEDLMFAHVPLKHIVHVGTLQDVVPEKLYQFNLEKTQAEWLDKLPADLKQPFVNLFKAGKLTGSALTDLIHLVTTRENGLKVPRITNHMRLRIEKKVRLQEGKRSQSAQGHGRSKLGKQQQASDANQGSESPATVSDNKKLQPRSGRSSSLGTQERTKSHQDNVQKGRFHRSTEVSPSQASRTPSHKHAKSKNKWQKIMPAVRAVVKAKSVVSYKSSDESVDALTGRPSELNRIQLNKLDPSEQEFVAQLANHQRRHAKFEYLDLLEKYGSDAEQAATYLPVVKNDPDFYREISPNNFARVLVTVDGKKKTIIKRNRSVASVDRIQRVYKLPDYGSAKNTKRRGILGLVVPPEPRRLPSIIKGQINSSGKRSVTEIDLIAHEEDATIKNQNIWGDQESLPIFQPKFSSVSVHGKRKSAQHSTRTEMLKEAGERLGYYMEKSAGTKSKVHRATAAIVSELRRKQDGGKLRPFSNRYLYRQLSDSVLIPHDPFAKTRDYSPPRTLKDYLRYGQGPSEVQTESKSWKGHGTENP